MRLHEEHQAIPVRVLKDIIRMRVIVGHHIPVAVSLGIRHTLRIIHVENLGAFRHLGQVGHRI